MQPADLLSLVYSLDMLTLVFSKRDRQERGITIHCWHVEGGGLLVVPVLIKQHDE